MKNRTNVRWLTQLALLAAILLVMNYTPLGYLQLGPLSASLLTVPVAIGAMTMGPLAGAILGGIFGATSFIQMVEGKSAMGAALFSVNPFGAFVVSFVARVLDGPVRRANLQRPAQGHAEKGKALLRHWCYLHPGAEHCVLHGLPGTVLL